MVVMPALFAFGFASEDRLVHRMREVANETEHALQTAEWAERERQRRIGLEKESTTKLMYVQFCGGEQSNAHVEPFTFAISLL